MPPKRLTEEEKLRKELKAAEEEDLKFLLKKEKFRQDNRIEFITTAPNPGFNPKQGPIIEAFLDEFFKIFGMSGGNRLGKTMLLTVLGISVMVGKYLWSGQSLLHLFPHNLPRKVRYIGQGWHDHIQGVVIPELKKWWPENRAVKTHGNGIITDTNWEDVKTKSSLEIMSNNQRAKEHEGWSGDVILYDEPSRREIYVANARGLTDRNGREIFAATLLDEPWIDQEIIKKVDEKGRPDRRVFWTTGTSYDNVGFGIQKEGVDQFADKLDDDEKEARIFGIPSYLKGLVYPTFKRKTHLKERFKIPLDWPVDIAIDCHPREKQAVLFLATDPRNDRYICDEIWDFGDGKWIGEEIIRKVQTNAYRVNHILIDPLSKGDQNNPETTYEKVYSVLAAYGYVLQVATKDLSGGILAVKQHLKGPNNQASIFLFDDMIRTLFEIEGYMWELKQGKPTGNVRDKDDHMMENLYRICLMNTKYTGPEDDIYKDYRVDSGDDGRNPMTGY